MVVLVHWFDMATVLNAFRHHGERDSPGEGRSQPPSPCSTPSGITASGTQGSYEKPVCALIVLNAFRHHGERDSRARTAHGPSRVLNAFRHHGERDFLAHERFLRDLEVLNAFRHHGERDCYPIFRYNMEYPCSTPSGITASGTSPERMEIVAAASCSTPSGITASGTTRGGGDPASRHGCSTPSGITASGTTTTASSRTCTVCSTPSGITASGTGWGLKGRSRRIVLNAFRHHGERDQVDPGVAPTELVLNAFRHHGERDRRSPRSGKRAWEGAQRLPASRRAGPVSPLLHVITTPCSTPSGITASGTCEGLMGHCTTTPCSTPSGITASGTGEFLQPVHVRLCSTPSGITASGTRQVGEAQRQVRVLNAFRHHGERDYGDTGLQAQMSFMCSTPSGITASGTPTGSIARQRSRSAQRLPASRRAGPLHGQVDREAVKCSTPSGITASGTAEKPDQHPVAVCSTPSGITASGTVLVPLRGEAVPCSTPSGITASGTPPRGRRCPGGVQCSTPSGITASGTASHR